MASYIDTKDLFSTVEAGSDAPHLIRGAKKTCTEIFFCRAVFAIQAWPRQRIPDSASGIEQWKASSSENSALRLNKGQPK
jgi:hypothetical protein